MLQVKLLPVTPQENQLEAIDGLLSSHVQKTSLAHERSVDDNQEGGKTVFFIWAYGYDREGEGWCTFFMWAAMDLQSRTS